MAITLTSTMDASVAALYEKDYLEQKRKTSVWAQDGLVNWKYQLGGANLRGSSIIVPMIEEMALATTALTESSDVTPVALSDRSITLNFYEYGNVVQHTRMLTLENYADQGKMAAFAVGQNQSRSIDKLVRDAAVGGTNATYAVGVGARTDLDSTNDIMVFADLMAAKGLFQNFSVPEFDDGYVCIANPLVIAGLSADSAFQTMSQYSKPENLLKGEVGRWGGFRFISHEYGKLYLGGGATTAAATTITAAIAAGDTTATTTTTNLAVGGYITIGTLEAADTEQVLCTAIAAGTIPFRGEGNTATNFGARFAHANGATLNYATNVGGVVMVGANSLFGAYASEIGKAGRFEVEWAQTNIPKRFLNHSWYWIGGFARNEHALLRLEVAVPGGILGEN
jgi:N4-gp56 family major capsid protein